jgi:hypothetical protein
MTLREFERFRVNRGFHICQAATDDNSVPKRRRLHNEELNDLYSPPNIIRVNKIEKNEMGGACSTYGGKEGCIQDFGGET